MINGRAAGLAWVGCGLGVGLAVVGLALTLASAAGRSDPEALAQSVLTAVLATVFGVFGALIVSRQPRNAIGWLLVVVGPSYAFSVTILDRWNQSLPATAALTPTTLLLQWLSSWSWWLLVGPLLLIPLVFPTGRLLSPRWRWVVILLCASFAAFLLGTTFAPTFTFPYATVPTRNPMGLLPEAVAQSFYGAFQVLLPAAALGSGAALLVRFRRAGAVERQQIKWVLSSGVLFVVAFVLQFVLNPGDGTSAPAWVALVNVVFGLSIVGVPLSIGLSILRYRLWDIDIVIRRTLVYAVLTGLLALGYFGSVVVLQNFFGAVTSQRASPLLTVLSTLVIAALFVPARQRVQVFIDQRFYRRKYDAARTLAAFGASVRDETNLEQLTAHLTNVVDETMNPQQVGLWLKPDEPGLRKLVVKL